jgi:hypothetical protein
MIDPKLDEVRSWLAKARQDLDALRVAATTLTPFAVTTRYPGDLPEISLQEAREALDHACQVWDFVLAHLPKKSHIP